MTEAEARAWLVVRYPAEAVSRLDRYVTLLLSEASRQNLISTATIDAIWARHIVDSAQLIDHARADWRHWVDIGSGAGLPGVVVAVLTGGRVTMIEPRRLRVDFLNRCIDDLALDGTSVLQAKAERVDVDPADVISARAVARLDTLLTATAGFTMPATQFVLPKGQGAQSEVAAARRTWQGKFHVEQSIVDPTSGIIIATQVAPR